MTSRESIFQALFALTSGLTWGSPPRSFLYQARRVKLFSDLSGQMPALCQAEHDEMREEVARRPRKLTLSASWIIYQDVGKDAASTPAVENNLILDAIEAIFPAEPEGVQSLGGLVHHCWIDGKVFKDPGDLDGVGMLIVPIKILIP
jgi:hypothetical protein